MFCHLKIDDLENETALTEYDLDDFHETLVTNSISSTDDIAKINKYQGLDHFVKKIMDQEEKKKNKEDIETLNSPDWKNKLPKNFQMLLNLFGEKPKNDNNFNNLNSFNNTIEKNNDLPLSTTLIDFKGKTEFEKNRRQFNKLFPMKKLKKTQSMPKLTLKIFSDEDETTPLPCANYRLTMMRPNQIFSNIEKMVDSISFEKEKEIKPKKITRELSFKNLAIKERLDFLENLRKGSIESPKEHILDHIRKKIESEIAKDDISSEHLVFSDMKGPWGEPWDRKVAEFQKNSAFGHFPSYQIKNIIIKGGDDLRQELIAMQIIIKFKQIFEEAGLKLYLRPYEIMVTSPNSGILGLS